MKIKKKMVIKQRLIGVLTFVLVVSTVIGTAIYLKPYLAKATTSEEIEIIGSDEVELQTYFMNENEEKNKEMDATTTEEIYLCFSIDVLKEGYFNGEIIIENSNFEIIDDELDEKISSIESNVITLQQVNNGETAEIKLKVEMNRDEEYDLNLLESETKITLTGTYANSKKEKNIKKTGKIKLTYCSPYNENDETLNLNVLTNEICQIEGKDKRLVQILVESSVQGNNYPVNETQITMNVPEDVEEVYVYSRGTSLTNGKSSNEEIEENDINWDKDNQHLEILLKNGIEETDEKSLVTWKETGTDDLIVTYILPEESEIEEAIEVTSSVYLYDGYINKKETTVVTETKEIEIDEEKNEIVTAKIASEKTSIYKGKIYSGNEKTINAITKLEINYAGIENEITIEEVSAKYQEIEENEETEEDEVVNELEGQISTKSTTIQKARAKKILGENGYISIIVENVEIARITADMLNEDEKEYNQTEYASITIDENNIEVQYNLDKKYNINIVIENAESQGVLYINNEYSLINEEYTREELNNINNLSLTSNIKTKEETEETSTNIKLKNTTTKANFQINNGTLTENEETEGVQFLVLLRNDNEKYDLYTNPEIEIELPEEIGNIEIISAKLVYDDGLEIVNNKIYETEEGKKVIKITMQGEQISYSSTSKGTYIIITTNLELGEIEESEEKDVKLNVSNGEEVKYEKNGELIDSLKYIKIEQESSENQQTILTENVASAESDEEITVVKTASVENGTAVKERQIIEYTIKITNNTDSSIENISVTDKIPDEAIYVEYESRSGYYNGYTIEDETVTEYIKTDITIDAGKTEEIKYAIIVEKNEENIGKELISEAAKVTIDGYEEQYESNTYTNIIEEGKIEISIAATMNIKEAWIEEGDTFSYIIKIKNLTDSDLTNLVITDVLPSTLIYDTSYVLGKNEYGEFNRYADDTNQDNIEYDENTNTVSFTLEKLGSGENQWLELLVESSNPGKNVALLNVENSVYITTNETERYTSNIETVNQKQDLYEISIENDVKGTYITEGEEFVYTVTLKNTGITNLTSNVRSTLPDGVLGNSISYDIVEDDGTSENYTTNVSGGCFCNFYIDLNPGATLTANIQVKADELEDGVDELEILASASYENGISNELYNIIVKATDSDDEEKDITGEENTTEEENIIEEYIADENITEEENIIEEEKSSEKSTTESKNTEETANTENNSQTISGNEYGSISGIVWIDENSNGAMESGEEKVSDIKVRLLNNSTNKYIETTTTNSNGYYEFSKLNNGTYIVEFSYDNSQYKLTEYQKENASSSLNSDVISGVENVGVGYTDKITVDNEDVENINMGLVYSGSFDLKLDKTVSSIVVSNDSGNTTKTYDNTSLAKVEISSKLINSSSVTITYDITVTNEGDIVGYVDKIVDYIPDGLTFNSSMNSGWHQSEGVLITESLSGQSISPGENKTVQLVLVKNMTESNVGTVSNSAEIMEASNSESAEDIDSTPNNKKISEDDYSTANVIISIKTGLSAGTITVLTIILLGFMTIAIYKTRRIVKLGKRNKKGAR